MTHWDEIHDSHSYSYIEKERLSQANIMSHVILHSLFAILIKAKPNAYTYKPFYDHLSNTTD